MRTETISYHLTERAARKKAKRLNKESKGRSSGWTRFEFINRRTNKRRLRKHEVIQRGG